MYQATAHIVTTWRHANDEVIELIEAARDNWHHDLDLAERFEAEADEWSELAWQCQLAMVLAEEIPPEEYTAQQAANLKRTYGIDVRTVG